MNVNWNFPTSDYGQRQGIGNSGVETFRGRPIRSLAREICQNSLDAGMENETVKIVFQDFDISRNDFPGYEFLADALNKCLVSWKDQKSSKTRDFLKGALDSLGAQKIKFLRVSDYNTTGLRGSNITGSSDWNNLVKSSGSSDKNEDAGGSFGIGKFAPFACSDLRTVFYSTKDADSLEATQGVSRLVSFKQDVNNDKETQGTGYYGYTEKNRPIEKCISLQEDYIREEPGTDIYISGFKFFEDWEKDIIKEVLDGFLYAIFMGTLEIEVNNVVVSKNTLDNVMNVFKDDINFNTKMYYRTLVSDKTKWIYEDFQGMGKIKLGLLLLDCDAPRKVAMIRKPWMKIKDQASINGSIPFVGVFIMEGEDLNKFLRKIENPQHTQWEPVRYETQSKIKTSKRLLKSIKNFIIEELNKMIIHDGIDELDLPGAGDILPMETEDETKKELEKDFLSPKISNVTIKKIKKVKTKTKKQETISPLEYEEMIQAGIIEEGDDTYVRGTGVGNGTHTGTGSGTKEVGLDEEGEGTLKKRIQVKPLNLRLICMNIETSEYLLVFTPIVTANNCSIQIFELDEQGNKAQIKINSAKQEENEMKISNGAIENISVKEGLYTKINVTVNKKEYFSGEVMINGNKR